MTPWSFDPALPAAHIAEQAELGERLGYRSFWLPESHFVGAGSNPSPLLLLAAVAARTERIGLATTSYLLPVRHPLHVAEEVAVLDRLSGGRVILGVGRGFRAALFAAFDVPPSEKRDRFEAALGVMRSAWQGNPVVPDEGEGEPVMLAPLPVQKPHPPVWVAAFGPKALAQAGRLGLPYLASPIEPRERLLANYAAHREALAESHGTLEVEVPVMRTLFAHRDASARERVRMALEKQAAALQRAPVAIRRFGEGAIDVDDWAIVGEPAAVADGVARLREELGMTHLIVRAQMLGAEEDELVESLHNVAELFGEPS